MTCTQGMQFAETKGCPERVQRDELLALDQLYHGARGAQPVGDVAQRMGERARARWSGGLSADSEQLVDMVSAWLLASFVVGSGVSTGIGIHALMRHLWQPGMQLQPTAHAPASTGAAPQPPARRGTHHCCGSTRCRHRCG